MLILFYVKYLSKYVVSHKLDWIGLDWIGLDWIGLIYCGNRRTGRGDTLFIKNLTSFIRLSKHQEYTHHTYSEDKLLHC